MKQFDESAFVAALTERESDAKDMRRLFKPDWLKDKELVPVLKALFDFMDEHQTNPSMPSLHEHMEDRDKAKYDARYKTTLAALNGYDNTKQMVAVKKAREVAAVYDYEFITQGAQFQKMLSEGDAHPLQAAMAGWLADHTETAGEGNFTLTEAFDKLITDMPWKGHEARIPTGIKCIDDWTYGGLRRKQMGIILAPTGGGKSAILLNIAHQVAVVEQKQVLFVTNELTVGDQAERFLARMQKPSDGKFVPIQKIQEDPGTAYRRLQTKLETELGVRLRISSVDLNFTAADLEALLKSLKIQYGFEPAVICIDYMERMQPLARVSKDKEWIFQGEIAKELVRLSKMKNVLIWTAAQTNRQGLNKANAMSMEQGQGSIRHFQEAATVIAARKMDIVQDVDGNEVSTIEFQELKQRHSAMHDRKAFMEVDLSMMLIKNKEVIPLNDAAIEEPDDGAPTTPKGKGSVKSQAKVKGKK